MELNLNSAEPITKVLRYAGIGSRNTPAEVLTRMQGMARRLGELGYVLRSGAAAGADTAFEAGCDDVRGQSEIWLPWPGFRDHAVTGFLPSLAHVRTAQTLHPAWSRLQEAPRALHARNVGQVLGADLASPVSFVLCFTLDGCESEAQRTIDTGGTGTAIVLADRLGIPVFNLANSTAPERLAQHVLAECRRYHQDGSIPVNGEVFVFGSNYRGIHGAGSAKLALERFGAERGVGTGRKGQSYAIATKSVPSREPQATLPLSEVAGQVAEFLQYARKRPEENFFVVRIGCQLATHSDEVIASLFKQAPLNCTFASEWSTWLSPSREPSRLVQPELF